MPKKLASFADLAKVQFSDLAPNSEPEVKDSFKKQYLEAHFSNKGRGGKTVTIIKGFEGLDTELKQFGKTLKKIVGVGGSIKNNEVIIQGNHRDKLMKVLTDMGHQVKRVGG